MREWAVRLLLLAAACGLSLAAAEMYLRIFKPQPLNVLRMRPDGILSHAPNLDVKLIGEEFSTRVQTNSAGLRDVERPLRKPAGVVRVLVLGDSMIEGLGVELDETMPKRLEAHLGDALSGSEVDVINAGVSGASGPLELLYLEREGMDYEPDLVIVGVTTRNDVHEAADAREVRLPPGYDLRVYLRTHYHLYGLIEKAINAAPRVRNTLAALGILSPAPPRPVVRTGRGVINTEVYLYDETLSGFEIQGYERLFEAYDRMIAICRAKGVPILFVILPSYFQATRYATALGDPRQVGAIVRNDREIQDRLLAFFRDRGVDAVDLLPGARRDPEAYYFALDQHFSVAGNAFAAAETARVVLDLKLLGNEGETLSPEPASTMKGG